MGADSTTVVSLSASTARNPWTLSDIAKACSLPLGLVVLNVLTEATTDTSQQHLSDGDFAVIFGFTIVLELGFLGIAAWFSLRKYGASGGNLGLRSPRGGGVLFALGLAVGLFLAALIFVYMYVGLLLAMGVEPEDNIPDGTFDRFVPIVLLALSSLIVAPIIEEIFFRGFVFGGLVGRLPLRWALLGSGLLFGLVHVGSGQSFYVILPPVTAIGIIFAWSYGYSGSILPSMGAHFLFNLTQFVVGLSQP